MSLEEAQASVLARTSKTSPEGSDDHKTLRPMVDVVTIILAIASVAFAYAQKRDSSELKVKTLAILNSTSTGYVAEFPRSIPVITNIVQGACGDLSITIDVPGYGEYSDPQAFYSYMHSILDLRHRSVADNFKAGNCVGKTLEKGRDLAGAANVRMLMFSPEDREAALRKQLTKDVLAKSLSDPSGRAVFINFFKSNPGMLQGDPVNFLAKVKDGSGYERFICLLLADFADQEKELRKAGVEMRYAREPSIMRVWLQDSEAAAFSFDHSNETEIAFQTRDPKLLNNFKSIFEQQWNASVAYADYWNAREKSPTAKINDVNKVGT
jgi:hypothetical protein